ncbi:ABC transporter ATP-binding protein [Cumulibacter manganitolerans]|uniref:ABC transporter ATP-binding protein n=1 Tax=Cumulibacter manganitolerans TaxID=1884992 RepID=UPI001885CCA7|nr:ABC transporter ATP-binding protein [Cumulibacter manganitolerans]
MTAETTNTQSSVSVRDVSKVFFAGSAPVWALENVSLEVAPGSFTCIVGPSGCGKSTLLRIIGGLEQATSGEVDIRNADDQIPAAFVFQEHGVFPWHNVLDNVAFGLRQKKVARAERYAVARDWLARVGLSGFEKSYPHELSGGMRQRIAIARAFATGSSLLLMDEPLGALDAQTRLLMQEELVRLWEAERKTVVMVTHGIEEALLLGDRVIAMTARPGRIKEDIDVPFARPRSMELERTAEFAQARHHVWELLRDEVKVTEEGR